MTGDIWGVEKEEEEEHKNISWMEEGGRREARQIIDE